MNTKNLIKSILTAATVILTAMQIPAGEITVKVTPQPLIAGERGMLHIINSGDDASPRLALPSIENLKWTGGPSTSMSTSIINMKRTVVSESIYSFIATQEGKYTIPPLDVKVGKQTKKTEALEFTVHPASKALQGQSGEASSSDNPTLDEAVFAKAAILPENQEFYTGEEVQLVIKLYIMDGLRINLSWPEITNSGEIVFREYAENQQNNRFAQPEESQERQNNKNYKVYTFRTAFRPLSSGTIKMSAVINTTIAIPDKQQQRRRSMLDDDFFDMGDPFGRSRQIQHTVKANIPDLKITPLPEIPEKMNFIGLTGNWSIKSTLSAETVKEGDPLTLKIHVSGSGSMDTLKAPEITIPGFRSYPPEVKKQSAGGFAEKAELSYILIPLTQGRHQIEVNPAVFSVKDKKYIEFPFKKTVNVEKSEGLTGLQENSQVVINASAPQNLKTDSKDKTAKTQQSGILYAKKSEGKEIRVPLYENVQVLLILLILAGPLFFALMEYLRYRNEKLLSNPELRRQLEARGKSGEILRKLKNCKEEDLEMLLAGEIIPYLNDIQLLPPGTSADELAQKLNDTHPELADALRSNAHSSYMPGMSSTSGSASKEKLLNALKKAKFVLIAAFMLTAANLLPAANTDFDNALGAYDKGNFKEAEQSFKKLLKDKSPDPALLYNIGNCRYQEGDLANALLCYERALRLAPGDSDILENLNFVRRKLMMEEKGKAENPLELLLNLRDICRPDTWMLLAGFFWTAVWIIAALRRKGILAQIWLYPFAVLCLGLAVSLAALLAQNFNGYSGKEAIVCSRSAVFYSLPSENARQLEIKSHPGDIVRVEEERGDWLRLRLDGNDVWCQKDKCALLWHWWK